MWRLGRILPAVAALAACASPWSRYDESLWHWYSGADPAAQREHLLLLREIVRDERPDGVRPPAGIRLALAWHAKELGEPLEASRALEAEARDYPESSALVLALLRQWRIEDVGRAAW
jgi:hypothetical protein